MSWHHRPVLRNRKLRSRWSLEALEDRCLPSATLAADVNPATLSSNPNSLVAVGKTVFFVADDGVNGRELHKSDGTEAGIILVKDIRPGSAGAFASYVPKLVNVNGVVFFTADDGTHGEELWKSDGTEAGTVLVKDIRPGSASAFDPLSSSLSLTRLKNTLFFAAQDPSKGQELFKSNGTEAGTVLVKDINPGSGWSAPANLTAVGGRLFFTAVDSSQTGGHGRELWKSNGTAAGTTLVKDIFPGDDPIFDPAPQNLTAVGNTLFFTADTGPEVGRELWKSNGTAAGTVLVKDIAPGFYEDSSPTALTNFNGTLFFGATDGASGHELYKSDGTAEGTVLVKEIITGAGGSSPGLLTPVGDTLFFTAFSSAGLELWKTDGSTDGTVMLRLVIPQAELLEQLFFGTGVALANVGGTLFFTASDGVTGVELYKSDGTPQGTVLVKDILTGAGDSSPLGIVNARGTAFFAATGTLTGRELFKSDGTADGTGLVRDLNLRPDSSNPAILTDVDGTLFFAAASPGHGVELHKSDGTPEGTVLVKDINPGVDSAFTPYFTSEMVNFNGVLFFTAFDVVHGTELWRSDGTEAGTFLVKDIGPGGFGSTPRNLTVVGDTLFFAANTTPDDNELFKTDGTEAGTVRVKDIKPGIFGSSPSGLTDFGGTLFFTADDGTKGVELWKSDGTEAGTVLVKDISPGGGASFPASLTVVNGTLFFAAFRSDLGVELWKTDGTAAGTVLVKDINAGSASAVNVFLNSSLTDFNGTLFFVALDTTHGAELWKSDGTEAGTVRVKDIRPGSASAFEFFSFSRPNLTVAGDTLFFTPDDGSHGVELWKTDGTDGGTVLVRDIVPGSVGSSPAQLTAVGATLFFTATEAATGLELWQSDGTTDGTVLVEDIRPGTASANPAGLAAVGDRLFFAADDGVLGVELWMVDTSAAGRSMVTEGGEASEGGGGREGTLRMPAELSQDLWPLRRNGLADAIRLLTEADRQVNRSELARQDAAVRERLFQAWVAGDAEFGDIVLR